MATTSGRPPAPLTGFASDEGDGASAVTAAARAASQPVDAEAATRGGAAGARRGRSAALSRGRRRVPTAYGFRSHLRLPPVPALGGPATSPTCARPCAAARLRRP